MQYKEIVSVTGLGGLFQLLATKSDGAIVRSLADNITKFIPSRLHNVTPLESIEIYTTGNNVRLHEVLQKMQESVLSIPDAKKASGDAIRAYFKEVYPDMDDDRVYSSDMKKMLKWYEILKGANLLDFSGMNKETAEEVASTSTSEANEEVAQTSLFGDAEEKPAKKAKAKKGTEEETGEKPAKKVAAKKTTVAPVDNADAPTKTTKAKKSEA